MIWVEVSQYVSSNENGTVLSAVVLSRLLFDGYSSVRFVTITVPFFGSSLTSSWTWRSFFRIFPDASFAERVLRVTLTIRVDVFGAPAEWMLVRDHCIVFCLEFLSNAGLHLYPFIYLKKYCHLMSVRINKCCMHAVINTKN